MADEQQSATDGQRPAVDGPAVDGPGTGGSGTEGLGYEQARDEQRAQRRWCTSCSPWTGVAMPS